MTGWLLVVMILSAHSGPILTQVGPFATSDACAQAEKGIVAMGNGRELEGTLFA